MVLSLLLLATALATPAAAGDWEALGTRQVNFVGDRDTIVVGGSEGRFNSIRLEVDKGNLEMFDIVVEFGDGTRFSPATRFRFEQGSYSREIDLPGDARVIKRVTFFYKSTLRKGRAKLTLWGRQATPVAPVAPVNPEPVPPEPVRPPPIEARWEALGERQVKFRGEKDTIVVTAKEGLFTAIKLEIDDGDLEMYNVVVTFGDGSKFSPETRFNFDQGSRSRTIDLPGNARFIRKVEFYYRSKVAKGHARLRLWGRHAN